MTKSPRNYVLIVVGTLVGLIGLVLLAGGGALLWANQTLKDDDGYFTSRTATYANDGRAIASENLDLGDLPGGSGRWGELRIRATGGATGRCSSASARATTSSDISRACVTPS